jgi:hypothetical protein
MKKLKIQKFHFQLIKIRAFELKKFLTVEILQFIEEHTELFSDKVQLKNIFHNEISQYSTIQLASEYGSLSITAYGKEEISSVKKWWKAYKKIKKMATDNSLVVKETYHLQYTKEEQTYQLRRFLVNRKKFKTLQLLQNDIEKYHAEMAKYLVSNFTPLYNVVEHWHDKDKHNVLPQIIYIKQHSNQFAVYKGKYRYGFDIIFKTKLLLPHLFRMGESTSLGYGTVEYM